MAKRLPHPRRIDLTGQVFGRLTVLRQVGTTPAGKARWRCRCACGKTTVVTGYLLRTGETRSCGCLRRAPSPRKADLTGQTFTRLTVLRPAPKTGPDARWICRCDCGAVTQVAALHLRSGRIRSCGCWRRDHPGRTAHRA